ncbi:MAG: hypothetical protein ACRBB2_01825 [Nitrosopumilus sp.]
MKDANEMKIKITKEELDNIVKCFERDRQYTNKESEYDADADMYLELLKSFKQQILDNQDIVERLRDHREYHQLCETKFASDSKRAQFHHLICQELVEIEKEDPRS